MLTKRTHIVVALLALLALPAVALAAGEDRGKPRARIASAVEARDTALSRPVRVFHRTIAVTLKRIEAKRRTERRERRRQLFATLPGGVSRATLEAIAACESGGDPTIVSADGSYRGKYQFSFETWATVGGSGDPAQAPEAEQDYRAALLYSQAGPSPWPVCGS